jgi:hypothetical protein
MATVKRRRSRLHSEAPPTTESHADSTGNPTAYDVSTGPPQPRHSLALGDRLDYVCPFCGSDDCNAKAKPPDGRLLIGCFGGKGDKECPIPTRMYLQAISEALGIPGATKEQIVDALIERVEPDGTLRLPVSVVPIVLKYRRP